MASTNRCPPSCTVEVATRTWAREVHNLFDFEADEASITSQIFTLRGPAVFVRNANTVGVNPNDQAGDMLLQLDFDSFRGKFLAQRIQKNAGYQACWQLIRGDRLGHKLAEGDIIKFGNVKFKVRQLALNRFVHTALNIDRSDCACHVDPDHLDKLADHSCRICLLDGSTAEDPLLAPCKCQGSIQHVHLECLRHWIKERLGLTNGDAPFVYKSLACELCKTAYSTSAMIGRRKVPLIEVDFPFIILEGVSNGRLNVFPFVGGRAVKVGRGHACDMNIDSASISRVQAAIELNDGHFVLRDHRSRFGTYIKKAKPWSLEIDNAVTVQVGRSLLSLTAKRVAHELGPESQGEFVSPASSVQGDVDTDNTETPRSFERNITDIRSNSSQEKLRFTLCCASGMEQIMRCVAHGAQTGLGARMACFYE